MVCAARRTSRCPMSVIGPLLVLVVLQSHQSNRLFMVLLPPLSVLATFALPTLKRGAINAIDWFAMLSFTLLASFVWLVWTAGLYGFPAPLARNLARLAPGFQPEFKILSFVCAVAVTVGWFALARWRLARHPKVLWRSVVLSSAGTTLMWVLLMTLWLPVVNYSRTYRDVAEQIADHLPADYTCISPVRLGDAQIATFAYFGGMHFAFDEDCDVILRQDTQDYGEPSSISAFEWKLVWEGRRVADRDERFRLYVRIERPVAPVKRAASGHAAPEVGLSMWPDVRKIAALAWPVLIGQLAIIAFGVIDTAMVGRYSAVDLAALGLGSSIYISVYIGLTGILHRPAANCRPTLRCEEVTIVRSARKCVSRSGLRWR